LTLEPDAVQPEEQPGDENDDGDIPKPGMGMIG